MANPNPQVLDLCRTLARLQAIVAEDRVTGEDDACIAACGTVMNYLAQEWGLDKGWLWDSTGQHDLAGTGPDAEAMRQRAAEEWTMVQARAERTVQMLVATGEAPTVLRSHATTQFGDLARQEGIDITYPTQED